MEQKEILYTLGTSNRNIDDFLDILRFYEIKVVVDIRRFPVSKRFPHFRKESLEGVLKENGISYIHIEALGGYRKGGYESYMETDEFKTALQKLLEIAKNERVCIICAEKFPWRCHRRFVSRALEEYGFDLHHIIEKGKLYRTF
jgi:uncharacterized protein (DUF488 family)